MEQNIVTKMNIQLHGIHWEKRQIKHTQMKRKQCMLLFRAWLCYFYITCTFLVLEATAVKRLSSLST